MSSASWVYAMAEDDVLNFSERSDERRQFFEETANRFPTTRMSPLVWAFFQIGDVEKLRAAAHSEFSWMSVVNEKEEPTLELRARDAMRLWKQRSAEIDKQSAPTKRSFSHFSEPTRSSPLRDQASPTPLSRTRSGRSSEGPEYSVRRDVKIANLCKEREQDLCAVSRIGGVQACHIYPWCAFGETNSPRVTQFWNILRMFWSEDKVESWRGKIFRDQRTEAPRGTETVENMLTLTSTLHRFHSEGAFALRPIRMSEDKTQLELEFHWLARQQRESTARVDLMERPLSSRGLTSAGRGYCFSRLDDPMKPTLLVSGTRFTMTTDDPTSKPLPDPGLLEMQWHLQRILAMSGAAGWKEEDFDYDDPDAAADALPSVEQWLDDQSDDLDQSRGSSSSQSSVLVVDDTPACKVRKFDPPVGNTLIRRDATPQRLELPTVTSGVSPQKTPTRC